VSSDSTVDPSKTRRLYLLLKERITSGAAAPGSRLMSEPALAEYHGVSRVTIRRALRGLEREGLIRRQPGAGTFVLGPGGSKTIVGDLGNMLANLVEMGRTTEARLLAFGYDTPTAEVADSLRLGPGERVQRSVRVRYVDGLAFSHLVAHVPERVGAGYTEADLASTPLLALLERGGVINARATQTLAGPDVAEALGVAVGSPLLAMTRVVFDDRGGGVEHLAALYRPDRYTFHMEMIRIGRGPERRWSPAAAKGSAA
jgi:GntR family transcriptional regulator